MPLLHLALILCSVVEGQTPENPIYQALTEQGITTSDGTVVKLPAPILPDGLDAAAQREAMEDAATNRAPVDLMLTNTYHTPVIVKVRTVKAPKDDEGPAIRSVDLWFVVHGDWATLTSKEFLESLAGGDEGKSRVVTKSGMLTDEELQQRKLTVADRPGLEERFVYSTFSLFDRVEISSTREAVLTRGKDFLLVAARVDPRFNFDAEYPNQWRALVRDEQAEIQPGPARPLAPAAGYAKITRLLDPADGILIECHIIYEEPYAWFDGINLVRQKAPAIVQEKARVLRRKLTVASEEEAENKEESEK